MTQTAETLARAPGLPGPGEHPAGPGRAPGQHLVAVPVLPDGSPGWEQRLAGVLRDLQPREVAVELESAAGQLPTALALLLPDPQTGVPRCAGMEVRSARRLGPGRVEARGPLGGRADAVLRPENLVPRFRPESMTFAAAFPEPVLDKWADLGVLRRAFADRVQLCPACGGLPTFRPGCPNCGSARTGTEQFIHHFTCAHVGLAETFVGGGEVVCPKCRTGRLVVGADYEYLTGPHRCPDCGWAGAELEHVAQCLRCGLRFPESQAHTQELTGYHVDRLAPLAG
jgi:hypothetical protein